MNDSPGRPSSFLSSLRDFVRGCVACWLGNSCVEFDIVAVPAVDASRQTQVLERATAALIGVNFAQNGCDWVIHQVASLRTERPGLPIILMLEPDDTSRADALARQLNVQGYIPTSSTVAVAAAALRFVVADLYFPATHDASPRKTSVEATVSSFDYRFASTRLTPREEAVLSVLASGAQNKIIAYQLSMSLSTCKGTRAQHYSEAESAQ